MISGFICILSISTFAQKLSVTDLKVEHLKNPMAIETDSPRFSWKIRSSVKNTLQSAYEIRVGRDKAAMNAGKDLVWKAAVSGDQSVLIKYEGAALQAKKNIFGKFG